MGKRLFIAFKDLYDKRTTLCCIFISIVVLWLDYITGKNIRFPILYIIPASLLAWKNLKIQAYIIAMVLPATRIAFNLLWDEPQQLFFFIINAVIASFALIIYVHLFDRIASQTRELRKKVRILEGILPICSSCKKIRNEKGNYEQMEKYVTEHSEASFSHGLCPECTKKLYPEIYKEITDE